MGRKPLGEILLSMGAVDPLKLKSALAYQRQWGTPLGKALIENKLCTREQVLAGLAKQAGMSVIDLTTVEPSAAALKLISFKVAQQHKVVGLRVEGKRQDVLVVAIAAPASIAALDAVRSVSGKSRVVAHLAHDEAIERAIARHYQGVQMAEEGPEGTAGRPLSELEFELG